jgi:hypothetical protein
MTLTLCSRTSAADWITGRGLPWDRLVTLGPDGFDAYGRLRLLPDPAHPGQSENDVDAEDWRSGQMPMLLDVLAGATTTPDDCFFCVWEGFGQTPMVYATPSPQPQADARPGLAPQQPADDWPMVVVPHRAYWLFRGPLTDVGRWAAADGWPAEPRVTDAEPAFVWPADRAWCLTHDVDPHWAGIGGSRDLIHRLVTDLRLDVVPADPHATQPFYY